MMWLILASFAAIFTLRIAGQDFVFPEDESVEDRISGNNQNLTDRLPIAAGDQCPMNMLLYPGDGNSSVWECDCKRGFLYFPITDSCHLAYRQGPCPPESYVVLPLGQVVPKCERNPCSKDGWVRYNNKCYELGKVEPCASRHLFTVNETTFQLHCEPQFFDPLMIINAPVNRCPTGSRRNALGQCRKMI